jgi:hypothetical protein
MMAHRKSGLVLLAVLVLGIGIGLVLNNVSTANAVQGGQAATVSPHYTVLETEGHNLLVQDNQTNIFYFYTVDKGAEIGSDLKLRGSVNLTQVGKDTIKPTRVNIQK